jgi:signal transduction histidine kinase
MRGQMVQKSPDDADQSRASADTLICNPTTKPHSIVCDRVESRNLVHISAQSVERNAENSVVISEMMHQISQPLHAIINFSDASIHVLEGSSTVTNSNLLDWLKNISEQTHKATEIVREARRWIREHASARPINVHELVDNCITDVNVELGSNAVQFRCGLNGAPAKVIADASKILLFLVDQMRDANGISKNSTADSELRILSEISDNTVNISFRSDFGFAVENVAGHLSVCFETEGSRLIWD